MDIRRRDLTRAALWLALCGWSAAPPSRAQPVPRWRSNPFGLGVASGQPRPDSVVLWTRLAAEDEPGFDGLERCAVRYEIFGDAKLRRPIAQGEVQAEAARAFSVHVHVQGLAPQREYWYRFRCGDAQSPVGRTRTAPAPEAAVSRLRFALAACQHYEQGYYAAHREIAGRELDFVLFVGDYIYEGSRQNAELRRHDGPMPLTLEAYRARHALYKRDADLQAAHAAHPWILTLDDHEVVNDYASDRDPAYAEPDVFLRRRAAAYRAYFEHMPLPESARPVGSGMLLRARLDIGTLARFHVLDGRQFRTPHACPRPGRGGSRLVDRRCRELFAPGRTMLGMAQERWLENGLRAVPGRWNLLAQQTVVARTARVFSARRRWGTDS